MSTNQLFPVWVNGEAFSVPRDQAQAIYREQESRLDASDDDDDEEDEDYEDGDEDEDDDENMDSDDVIDALLARIDSLEAERDVALALLSRADSNDEDEDDEDDEDFEDRVDSLVSDRVSAILSTYDDARSRGLLPADFRLDSVTSAAQIKIAALQHFDAHTDSALDFDSTIKSFEALDAAYAMLSRYKPSKPSAIGSALFGSKTDSLTPRLDAKSARERMMQESYQLGRQPINN